jgi:hypothetical protein
VFPPAGVAIYGVCGTSPDQCPSGGRLMSTDTKQTPTGSEGKTMLTAPAATALAALMTVLGGIAGALITGYFNRQTSVGVEAQKGDAAIRLEHVKLETVLVTKAIDTQDQVKAVKLLQFYAEAGLIPNYKDSIVALTTKDKGLGVPVLGTPEAPGASRFYSFAYQTSPTEIDAGRREWKRVDDTHWTESYPHGQVSKFVTKARTAVSGCNGTALANEQELDFQVFIPDKGCNPMALWFRRNTQDWIYLQPMIDIK